MEIQDIIIGLTSAEIAAITLPDERTLIVNETLNQAVIYVNGTFKQCSFTDTDDITEGLNKFATAADLAQITTNQTNITSLQTGKEDAFTKNTAFNKDFGTSAGEVLEGDTTTISPSQSSDITTNNAKVSFPEAPNDGKQYARKDLGWEEVTSGGGGSSFIACCPFGAKSDSKGKFLIANGKSSDADDSSKPKTRQPIGLDGTLVKLVYKTKEGTSSTQMKIHINGTVEETVTLSNINANYGGVETINVSVSAGDYVEIEYDDTPKPGECTMYFIQEL